MLMNGLAMVKAIKKYCLWGIVEVNKHNWKRAKWQQIIPSALPDPSLINKNQKDGELVKYYKHNFYL